MYSETPLNQTRSIPKSPKPDSFFTEIPFKPDLFYTEIPFKLNKACGPKSTESYINNLPL